MNKCFTMGKRSVRIGLKNVGEEKFKLSLSKIGLLDEIKFDILFLEKK